ncbi:hypothetical protein QZH41_017474, partial [Actinostola sp. cb2023]
PTMAFAHFFIQRMLRPRILTLRSPCGSLPRAFFSSQSVVEEKDAIFSLLTPQDISPKSDDVIAGRKWLPGSQGKGFPKFLGKPRQDFPHALQLKTTDHQYSMQELGQICRRIIDNDLSKYGAIVFRGLPLTKTEDFADLSLSMAYKTMDYTGGSANRKVIHKKANVYTANDDPSAYTIELHNELAYAPVYPRKLSFFCLEQPAEGCGGHTVLCDSRELLTKINPDILQKLEEKQVRYWYRVPHESNTDYRSWQQMFVTSDKKLIFYCLQEPAEGCGGFTVICDSKEFMARLDPKMMKKLEDKQICYIHRLPDESKSSYVSWQQTFKTNDVE